MSLRLDFHIHTLSVEEKDDGFTFSPSWLKRYTTTLHIDVIAITNHNSFDKNQFIEIKDGLSCIVLPGVELSLEGGHVNLVFENTTSNIENLAEACANIDLGEKDGLSVNDFKKTFSKLTNGLFIYEYGKSNSLVIDDKFSDPFFNTYTFVRGVNSQLKFQRALLQKEADCPALFSDAHATEQDPDPSRNDISKLALKNTFLQVESFNFKQMLVEFKQSQHVTVTADGTPHIFQIDMDNKVINVSTGLNLLVGRRGTGKTYFLDHINEQYSNSNSKVSYIQQFKSSENTEKFLQEEKKRIASESRNQRVRRYNSMLKATVSYYKEPSPDTVDEYLQSVKRFSNELVSSKTARKVALFAESLYEIKEIGSVSESLAKLKEVIEDHSLWQFTTPNLRDSSRKNFFKVYEDLRENIVKQETHSQIQEKVNETMALVKTTIQKITAVEPVIEINLINQFARRKEQVLITDSIGAALSSSQDESVPEYSYTIHVWKENWTSAKNFKDNAPIKGGHVAVNDKITKPYLRGDYKTFLDNLFSKDYLTLFTIDSALDLSRYLFNFQVELLTEAGKPASGGQQMALGLMMKLDDAKKSDIILVDEPEGSLDNVFIKESLIPKLRELAKTTPVFVITHNSTLGALLQPDRLLIAKFDSKSKEYQLRTGDFTLGMVSDGFGNQSNSYEDFVDAMEAGIDTYKEKGQQYETLRKN